MSSGVDGYGTLILSVFQYKIHVQILLRPLPLLM